MLACMTEADGGSGAPHRNIPEPIKRVVRQRCGFGCVICGNPIIEYHHMTPWHFVQEHTPENITLLCDSHHREATPTPALLPESMVREADANPFNLSEGKETSASYSLRYGSEVVRFELGSNSVSSDASELAALLVLGDRLLWFSRDEGVVQIGLRLFAEDGSLAVAIKRNELTFKADQWDVTFEGATLRVWEASRKQVLEVQFEPPQYVRIRRALFRRHGFEVEVTEDEVRINGAIFSRVHVVNCNVGIMLGHDCLRHGAAAIAWEQEVTYSDAIARGRSSTRGR